MATIRLAEPGRDTYSTRVVVGVVATLALALVVRANEGTLAQIALALGRAHYWWLLPAIAIEVVSVGALAAQQRQLLGVRGGHYSFPAVASTTCASTTISASLPIVGSPASAMYSYRRFTSLGAPGTVAAWALVLSGIYSSLTLAGIVALGGVVSGNLTASLTGIATLGLGVAPLVVGVAALQYRGVRRTAERVVLLAVTALYSLVHRERQSRSSVVRGVQRVAALRLSNRSSAMVVGCSALNWLLDIACLACAILALGGQVPWQQLVLVWAAGVGVSSLHLTPGGLGVVEAALTLALVAAGMPAAMAVAAVLLYRVVSFWLVLAAGAGVLCASPWRQTVPPDMASVR